MAATILARALNEKGVTDDQLVGVLYLLGRCAEERGQRDEALEYYQRVFVRGHPVPRRRRANRPPWKEVAR